MDRRFQLAAIAVMFLVTCLFTFSCEHDGPKPVEPPPPFVPPDFKFQGTNSIHSTMSFEALNVPDSVTVLWNFGDSTYGSSHNITHTYSKKGSYEVTLQVNADSIYKIVKILTIIVASDRLSGLRHWTGTSQFHHDMEDPPHPTTQIDDSVASVNSINDTSITFLDTFRMRYLPSKEPNIITFKGVDWRTQLTYYIANDSMSYYSNAPPHIIRNLYLHTN
jgi:PKD repeat protein